MAAHPTRRKTASPATPAFPRNARDAMQMVFDAHQASQRAFTQLLTTGTDDATRIQRLRDYRESTTRLLLLQHAHNDSGLAPTPWDTTIVAQTLAQQALIEADLTEAGGNGPEAARLRAWVLELAKKELPPLAVAGIQLSLTNQAATEGRFNEALAAFADLRRLFTDAGETTQAVQTTLDEVALLDWLGDYDRALASLKDARALLPAVDAVPASMIGPAGTSFDDQIALLRAQLTAGGRLGQAGGLVQHAAVSRAAVELVEKEARIRKARGEYDKAASLWESVLPYYASLGGAEAIEFQLAVVDRLRGQAGKARDRLARIEPAFSYGLFSGKVAGLRQMQSWAELDLGNASRALTLANQGLAALETNPDEDLAWRLYWRKAAALRALGRSAEAIAAYLDAAAKVDSLRKSPLGYRLDSTSLIIRLPLIEEGIALAAQERDGRSCLRLIETVKARALSSALSVPAAARTTRTGLEREFDAVTQRLDALEYSGLSGAMAGADATTQRQALLDRRLALMEQIRLRDPRWRGLTAPTPFDPDALAAALTERTQAALTLYLSGTVVRAVLVIDGRFEVAEQRLSSDTLQTLRDCADALQPKGPGLNGLDPATFELDASMFVPSALLDLALSRDSLLIAPHNVLHLLPWASMPYNGSRLFERVPVGVIPNLTCALSLGARHAAAPRAALAGVANYPGLPKLIDLPAAGRELDALSALYADRLVTPPLRDGAATESAVRALAARDDTAAAILHLACHGTLDAQDPLGAGVLMADGKIDAAEWAQLRLHYEEVVLSACSTGWRPLAAGRVELRGDDILGLPGALLEAGARAIVVSIPKASDAGTEAFMTAYHRRRASGAPPLTAFCHTQRELLAGHLPPQTWTGIVCYAVQ
jgi:tetratricopeptide (TPR) repeat protein